MVLTSIFARGSRILLVVDREGPGTTRQFMEIGACCEDFAEIRRWWLVTRESLGFAAIVG